MEWPANQFFTSFVRAIIEVNIQLKNYLLGMKTESWGEKKKKLNRDCPSKHSLSSQTDGCLELI